MFKKAVAILLFMLCCMPASYAQKNLFSGFMKKMNAAREALFKKPTAKPAEQAAQTAAQKAGNSAERAAQIAVQKAGIGAERAAAAARVAERAKIPWNIEAQYRAAAHIRHYVPKQSYQTTFLRFERAAGTPVKEWFVNGDNIVFASRAEVAKYMAALKSGQANIPVKNGMVQLNIEPAFDLQNIEYRQYTDLEQLKKYRTPSAMTDKEYQNWRRGNVQDMLEKGEGIDWKGIDALPY